MRFHAELREDPLRVNFIKRSGYFARYAVFVSSFLAKRHLSQKKVKKYTSVFSQNPKDTSVPPKDTSVPYFVRI